MNGNDYQYVINDFIIMPELCNFKCDYCLFEEAPEQKKCGETSEKKKIKTVYDKNGSNEDFFQSTQKTLKKFDEAFKTPVLRICGGELFYLKDMITFLESVHNNYEKVQIISNGYFLDDEIVTRIKKMGNCILHVSLDGHTLKLNRRRVKSEKTQSILLNNILNIIKKEIPLEIASCLTDANTGSYQEVAAFFNNIGGNVLLLPFPVRGEECKAYFPSAKAKASFAGLLDQYETFKAVLPPKKYLENIVAFYQSERRVSRCHIPKTIVQTFHNGDIYACCMDWSVRIANMNKQDAAAVKAEISRNKIYKLYGMNPPRLVSCKTCFTVSDMINLYLNDEITREEFSSMELYQGTKTMECFDRIKRESRIGIPSMRKELSIL